MPTSLGLREKLGISRSSKGGKSEKTPGKSSKTQATINMAIESITILKGFVPFEPAQAALDSLCGVLKIAVAYIENEESAETLAERCQRVGYIIKTAAEGQNLEENHRMLKAIEDLQSTIKNTLEAMEKKRTRSKRKKLLYVLEDADEIATLDSMITQFIAEFHLHVTIISDMKVSDIWKWVKAQDKQRSGSDATQQTSFFTPSRPAIFFGRDEVVEACVSDLLGTNLKHVALIGTGGVGKSTVSKAVLNEDAIVTRFNARLFITYDSVGASAMTYQIFLDRISKALGLSASTSAPSITQFLKTVNALLVIDNAETFLDAPQSDTKSMYEFLTEIGSHSATRILMTTRNTETIPLDLPWHHVYVAGLDAKAALDIFNTIYPMSPTDSRVVKILSDLGHHPLSINLLANVALMNDWSAAQLDEEWERGKTQLLDLTKSDKSRSLPATIDISVASFKRSPAVLQILQTIAFLPQGIDREDMSSIFPSILDISSQVEAIRRSSLIYRNGKRLTMLPPVRMYISEQYNNHLPYNSPVLSDVRTHYHSKLSNKSHNFVEREHGNIDHLMHFDMTSELYRADVNIHALVLDKANCFLYCTTEVVQRSSLWPLLVLETAENSFSQANALAQLISLCLTQICWVDYRRDQFDDALLKLDIVEKYCRDRGPVCHVQLVECLRLRGGISQEHGNLTVAAKALQEALSIAKSRNDSYDEALLNESLARVLLSQGKIAEAKHLFTSAQEYYESNQFHSHLRSLLLSRGSIAISQNDFHNARIFLSKSMELDREHNGGRQRLGILNWKASCEGWAGEFSAAKTILEEATKVKIGSGTPQFIDYMEAMRGKAYYEARLGKLSDARQTITHAIELNQESGGNLWNNFVSACIELFSDGGRHTAESMLQMIVDQDRGSDKNDSVIYHRTLGEVMLLNGKAVEAKAQFETAKAICDENGMSPRHLYVNIAHWFSLPAEYDGWTRYLDGHL